MKWNLAKSENSTGIRSEADVVEFAARAEIWWIPTLDTLWDEEDNVSKEF